MTKNLRKNHVKDKPKDAGFKVTFHFDKPDSVYFLLDWGSKSWTIEYLKFDDLINYFNDRGETVIDYPKLEYDHCTRDCKDGSTLIAVRNRTDWKEILISKLSYYTDEEGVSGSKNALNEYEKTLPYEINPNR